MGLAENVLDAIFAVTVALPINIFVSDVAEQVNYQFIDEVFHYRQLKHYLRGDWHTWDPKITTPPGLYWLTWLYAKITGVEWTLANMRWFNFIGGCFLALCCVWIRSNSTNPGFNTASIFLNPLLALYYSLYYTDVWSTAIVVFAYAIVVAKPFGDLKLTAGLAAAVGAFSVTFRQTNIVWCAFLLVAIIDQKAKDNKKYQYEKYLFDFRAFFETLFENLSTIIPFILTAATFVIFVVENGGITLGDKSNHEVVPHVAQLCYCMTFLAVFTLPLWISLDVFKEYITSNFGNLNMLLFNSFWIPVLAFIVQNFTVIHPFLLADNRHYTFYIVRQFIIFDEYSKFKLIPVYHFSFYVISRLFLKSNNINNPTTSSLVMYVGWIMCTAVTIIPSPLFEPRYYILPYVMLRLLIQPDTTPFLNISLLGGSNNKKFRFVFECIWQWMWTQALYLVFLQFTFQWENLPEPQRIIW